MKHRYSLSTSWLSSKTSSGESLIREIASCGFNTVELGFSLKSDTVDQIMSLKRLGLVSISSLHNMCPIPNHLTISEAMHDYYSLASTDEKERRIAVSAAKNTILTARSFDAKAVVLHAGRVEVKDRMRELAAYAQDREKASQLREMMIKERSAASRAHFSSIIKSLDELVPFSMSTGVPVGIETRYHYREIPILDEMEEIFARFAEGSLYYWHDTGHAETFQRLGLAAHKDFLDKFSNRLLGVHLHDIMGPMGDHRAPGTGSFDFKMLKPYITAKTIMVVEAHQPATQDEIKRGLDLLIDIFGS